MLVRVVWTGKEPNRIGNSDRSLFRTYLILAAAVSSTATVSIAPLVAATGVVTHDRNGAAAMGVVGVRGVTEDNREGLVVTSPILISWSSLPEATVLPSGQYVTERTPQVWPRNVVSQGDHRSLAIRVKRAILRHTTR